VSALFELSAQYRDLLALADSDELPPEFIADTLSGLEGEIQDKSVAIAKFILSLEANSEAISEASKAMQKRAERIQKRADSIRAYLLFQWQSVDMRKLETPELRISRRNNPVAVQVQYEAEIPDRYWVDPPPPDKRLDKKQIKADLQAGIEVPGCYLESGERVSIDL
jgi:hypothetical protein